MPAIVEPINCQFDLEYSKYATLPIISKMEVFESKTEVFESKTEVFESIKNNRTKSRKINVK